MWASVTFIRTRGPINPRTEQQCSQSRGLSEFTRNGTHELIIIWCNRMARKCEQSWHSCKQEVPPIHVLSHSVVNELSSPSSLAMEPVSWLSSVQIEWQGNVSKRAIHTNNKTHKSTYRATVQPTTSVLRVRSEWNPWVDFHLFK
jgi:hypothetical protein